MGEKFCAKATVSAHPNINDGWKMEGVLSLLSLSMPLKQSFTMDQGTEWILVAQLLHCMIPDNVKTRNIRPLEQKMKNSDGW